MKDALNDLHEMRLIHVDFFPINQETSIQLVADQESIRRVLSEIEEYIAKSQPSTVFDLNHENRWDIN